MLIEQISSSVMCPMWSVTLDCPAERALSDEDLARIVENFQGVRIDRENKRFKLRGRNFGPAIDGTYAVERNGDKIEISIRLR